MAKEKAASVSDKLTAYNVHTKEKGVEIKNAVIDVTNGRFIAKGVDDAGNKLTTILGREKAEGHIAAKRAKKGKGW